MKNIWTKEKIEDYFIELREKLGYKVDLNINIIGENKLPVSIDIENGKISVVLDFLNALDDESVKAHLGLAYVAIHKAEDEKQYEYYNGRKIICMTTQQCMDELCDNLGIEHVSVRELSYKNHEVRRKIYPCGRKYHSYYEPGNIVREGICKYEVVGVLSKDDDITIRFKKIFPEADDGIFEEKEEYVYKHFSVVYDK